MTNNDDPVDLAALADGTVGGPEWDAWLAAHPEAAAEVVVARRVRLLLAQMQSAEVELPADLQERVMAQVRANTTLFDLLELIFLGAGRTLREVLDALFAENPTPASNAEG